MAVTASCRWKKRLWLPPLLFTLLLAPALLPAQPSEKELKEAELRQLRETIGQLRSNLEQVRGRYDRLSKQLADTERAISRISRDLHRTRSELKQTNERLSSLRKERGELQQQVSEQRDRLAAQIRAAYASGRQEYIKLLLNQQDPATVGRMLVYYDYLNRARTERIGDLLSTLQRLETVTAQISEERSRLTELEQQQSRSHAELQASKQERKKVVALLEEEIRSKDSRLKRMLADEEELQRLIKALAEALADIPVAPRDHKPFTQRRGELDWPAKGRLSRSYGEPRGGSDNRWRGILIGAGEGDEVHAVSHGRIAFADWLRGYGMLIIIDHGEGYMSLYGHNQSLYKEAGDWVETGEAIATVGSSGGQGYTGLYFEIRQDGRPRNPERWLAKR